MVRRPTLTLTGRGERTQASGPVERVVRRVDPPSAALKLRHDLFGFLYQLAHDLTGGRDIVDQLAGHTCVERGIFDVWREAELV